MTEIKVLTAGKLEDGTFSIYNEAGIAVAGVSTMDMGSSKRWEVGATQDGNWVEFLSLPRKTSKAGVLDEIQRYVVGKLDEVDLCELNYQDVVQAMEGLQGLGLDSGEAYRVLEARKGGLEREAGKILRGITAFIHRSEDEYQWVEGY